MDRRTLRKKKTKTRNAKPYDRPNQNQSIFGRVASTFKGILNPSWIFNVSQWMGAPEEQESSTDPEDEESADEEASETPAPQASKRPRLEQMSPPVLSEGTQTWLDTPSPSLFNPNPRLSSTVTQNSLIENKQDQVIINGDDHSDNSEGSASTSGCSSLVSSHKDRSNCLSIPNRRLVQSPFDSLRSSLNRRDVTSRKDADMSASRLSLWSASHGYSPVNKLQRRSPAAASFSQQPGFSVGSFVGSPKTSHQLDKKVASPFYQGKTSFGGASSIRRMPMSVAPYQVDKPSRNQIKVRPKESEDSLEGMSSAAKRILMTLEKMSSPVIDAKKIPNTNKSPVDLSLYLKPPRLRTQVISSPTVSKGPPIANISTLSKLTTLKSCMRLQNTSMDSFSAPREYSIPPSESVSFTQPDSIPQPLSPNRRHGKMRCKLNQKHQSSAKNEEFEYAPTLPSVPLPISNLPKFKQTNSLASLESNIATNEVPQTGIEFEFSPPIEIQPALPPIVPDNWSHIHQIVADKQPFTFSKPNVLDTLQPLSSGLFVNVPSCEKPRNNPSSTHAATTTNSPLVNKLNNIITKSTSMWRCKECYIENPLSKSKCMACENPKEGDAKMQSKSISVSTPKATSSWECPECWIQNPAKESKCIACETPRKGASSLPSHSTKPEETATKPANSIGFSTSLPKQTTWQCDSCWTPNPAKESKCLACEAPNPSSASQEKAPGSFPTTLPLENCQTGFKFPSLLVSSSDKPMSNFIKSAMAASEAKKPAEQPCSTPNGTPKVTKELSGGFASDWECDTCLSKNASDKLKCLACETLRPSKRSQTGLKDPESFKFSSPVQNSPMGFKFGSYSIPPANTVPTTSFGSSTMFGSKSSTTGTNSFFGSEAHIASTGKTSVEPKSILNPQPLAGFKFGTSAAPVTEKPKTEIPVIDLVDNDDSEVQSSNIFGNKAKESDTSSASKALNVAPVNNPSDTTASSFFKIPTSTVNKLDESKVSLTDSSTSQPSLGLFKFGAASQQAKETPASETPVINLAGNEGMKNINDNIKPVIPTSTVTGNTIFSMPTLPTENKSSPFAPAKENATSSQPALNSIPIPTQTAPSKETPTGGFNFKAPTALGSSPFGEFSMPPANSDSSNKPLSMSTPVAASNEKKSDSPFVFGVSSSSISSLTTTVPAFNQADTPKATVSPFGVTTTTTQPPLFAFGSTTATTTSSLQFPTKAPEPKPAVSVSPFGASAPAVSNAFTFGNAVATTAPAAVPTAGFSFFAGSTAPAATTAPALFTFGAASNATQPAKTGGFPAATTNTTSVFGAPVPASNTFVFGAAKTEPVNSTPSNFTFGSGTMPTQAPTSNFTGFQAAATQPASNVFQFGSQPTNSAPAAPAFGAPSGGFTFGAKSDAPNAPSQQTASAFGVPSMQQQPLFGATTAPAFGKADNKPAGFNFGAAAASSSQPFVFGNVEKKQAPNQFSFGATPDSQNVGQFQPQFNVLPPNTFNFGATTQPGAFQFSASTSSTPEQTSQGGRKIRKAVRRVRN